MAEETLSSKNPVTDADDESSTEDNSNANERDEESTESSPTEENEEEETPRDNAQKAIQEARERENAAVERARAAEKKLREKELSKMTEADRVKEELTQTQSELAELKVGSVIDTELAKVGLASSPIAALIKKSPMGIPGVQEDLGEEYSLEDAVTAVKKHLPSYLESVVADLKPKSQKDSEKESDESEDSGSSTASTKVDEERSAPPVKDKIYSREEIAEMAKNPEVWAKVKDKVLAQVANKGGILPA